MNDCTSVIDQVCLAFQKQNRKATAAGFVLGGFVPSAIFSIIHWEINRAPYLGVLVAGGLLFSAKTVYEWTKVGFHSGMKALGFVILTEGVMTLSGLLPLQLAALALLVCVNGIATGCNLALNRKQARQARVAQRPKTEAKVQAPVKRERRKSVRVNFKKGKKRAG